MFSLCFAQVTSTPGSNPQNPRRLSSGLSTLSTPVSGLNKIELFIPAPEHASREASFHWHITTRNFFAFVFRSPLVGTHMGQALVDLQERMHLFRSGQINNHKDFLDYADSQGYRDFVDCPDYALSMLYYAERYKLRDVWIDAFAHCVGMNESLALSQEFAVSLFFSSKQAGLISDSATFTPNQSFGHPGLFGNGHSARPRLGRSPKLPRR